MLMKQYSSGNLGRKIGGMITTFSGSLIILSPFSFIGIVLLVFDKYIQQWMSLTTFIVIGGIFFIFYEWSYFAFVYPAIINYSSKQSFIHGNPIKDELNTINKKLDELNKLILEQKEMKK